MSLPCPITHKGIKEEARVFTDILEVRVLQCHEERLADCVLLQQPWVDSELRYQPIMELKYSGEVNKEHRLITTHSLGPVSGNHMAAVPGSLPAHISP